LRRSGIYALIGAIGGAIPGTVATVVEPNDTSPPLIVAAVGLTAVAGYMIGQSQPVPRVSPAPKPSEGRAGILGLLRPFLYRIGIGLLVGFLFASLAQMLWFPVLVALAGQGGDSGFPLTPLRRAAGLACGNAMFGSALAGFAGSIVGSFLGGAIRSDHYAPPTVWVAAWAGVLGLLIGSSAGAVPGTFLSFDIALIVTLSSGVPAGIAAALIVWILVKRKLTAVEP